MSELLFSTPLPWLLATAPTTAVNAVDWRYLLWPIGSLLTLIALLYGGLWLWEKQQEQKQPLLFLVEQLLWHFRIPLVMAGGSAAVLITMGFLAGSKVSMILFVGLSGLTVVGLGILAYWVWPDDAADGNMFDLVPLPHLEWPAYENSQDRLMRAWVQEYTRKIKSDPPPFSGAAFGTIALEISKEAADIYEKDTPLSVSVDELLKGVERTAADLKILTNHLPLAGHYTLAEIERQVEFAMKRGKLLYAGFFLVLSFFNPGNLVRVFLIFVQQKSPWEHILQELQGWIYGNYAERLGYHMSLIHSRRKPPSPNTLLEQIQAQEAKRGEEIRIQKLGWLAFMGLFTTVLYLGLQLTNASLVFGWPAFCFGLVLLVVFGFGVWGFFTASRWEGVWQAILPKWHDVPPPEGEREYIARQKMALVLRKHKQPPAFQTLEELKELPSYYGHLFLAFWKACYDSYRPKEETDPHRSSRDFYLPQAFAGIECLCRDLHGWFGSSSFLPKTLRQLERFGFNLETVYNYLQAPPKELKEAAEEATEITAVVKAEEKPNASEATEEEDKEENKGVWGWFGRVGRSLGNYVKGLATQQLHKAVLEKFSEDIGERFIEIYGARHPSSMFKGLSEEAQEVEVRSILLLGREAAAREALLDVLLGEDGTKTQVQIEVDEPEAEEEAQDEKEKRRESHQTHSIEAPDGTIFAIDSVSLPGSREDQNALSTAIKLLEDKTYNRVLLVDIIDYGAKERIVTLLEETLMESLRINTVGGMALVLMGVEKLKPMQWDPPYDDYLQDKPKKRKSQRIRNAVLAWAKIFENFSAMESIYPVGIPAEGESWGVPSVRRYLGLPEELPQEPKALDAPQPEPDASKEPDLEPSQEQEAPTDADAPQETKTQKSRPPEEAPETPTPPEAPESKEPDEKDTQN